MKSKILALLLCIAVVIALVMGWKALKKESDNTTDLSSNMTDFIDERPNADNYYSENSVSLNEIQVKDSENVQSEKEVLNDFEERGFGDYPVYTSYSMNGDYSEEMEISDKSEKHPVYKTYYLDKQDEIWMITSTNGTVTAFPIYYNLQKSPEIEVIFSESQTITSYDSASNKFYETIPKEDVVEVKVVSKIDAETLDALSQEVIDTL